jgi:hypothetical protein
MAKERRKGTFAFESIEAMRRFFIKNANSDEDKRLDCINTMNTALRLLLGMPRHPVGSAVHKTMNSLRRTGHAVGPRIIEFLDKSGIKTIGIKPPEELSESILDVMLEMTEGETGWSVFGLSIMDGYHSVTLTLDYNDPLKMCIYWSDQWNRRGGWEAFNQEGLDKEITWNTKRWWEDFEPEKKPRTRTTLWRVLP